MLTHNCKGQAWVPCITTTECLQLFCFLCVETRRKRNNHKKEETETDEEKEQEKDQEQENEEEKEKETRWSPRTRMQTRSKSYICPNDTLVGHSCGTLL